MPTNSATLGGVIDPRSWGSRLGSAKWPRRLSDGISRRLGWLRGVLLERLRGLVLGGVDRENGAPIAKSTCFIKEPVGREVGGRVLAWAESRTLIGEDEPQGLGIVNKQRDCRQIWGIDGDIVSNLRKG